MPKLEWNCFKYPNSIEVVGITQMFLIVSKFQWSTCILPKLEWSCSTWPNLKKNAGGNSGETSFYTHETNIITFLTENLIAKHQISKSEVARVKPGTPTGRPTCRPSSAKYKFHCAYIFHASFVLLDIVVSKLHYHKTRGTMWGICLKIKETNLMMCGTYF